MESPKKSRGTVAAGGSIPPPLLDNSHNPERRIMSNNTNTIRDLRESKQLSEDKVAAACGLTYSRFVRIQEGSGKTTPEEIAHVLGVLKGMEPGTRKLAGRPFKDTAKQAAVDAARAAGTSVHAVVVGAPAPAPAKAAAKKAPAPAAEAPKKPAARAKKPDLASALGGKTPRKRK